MTDPKNAEDQELSLDQLKDAAGGVVHPEFRDRLGGAGDKLKDVIITSVNDGSSELDKSSTKYNPGKGASITVDPKTGDKRSTSPKSNVFGSPDPRGDDI